MEDRKIQRILQMKGGKIMKKENGITLIALIITIIILVILAAVSIRAAYESGIINYAVNGTSEYANQSTEESKALVNAQSQMESVLRELGGIQKNSGLFYYSFRIKLLL